MRRWWIGASLPLLVLLLGAFAFQNPREMKVRGDRQKVEAQGFWIYNDLNKGFAEARRTNKPVLVVFRCIPCEQCAQLDEELVELNPSVQKLLAQFVCVRVVHANGMDLSLFQFDYDQSWAAFFLNGDRTIYGRYGTRSHRTESAQDVTLDGFARALEGALEIHKGYPANRKSLEAKRGPVSRYPNPESFPWLSGRYRATLDYEGRVVQSCIHCHQVGEGMRLAFRTENKPVPESILFPYPNPRILGLNIDPRTRSTLASVRPGSTAEKDGFRAGDEIATLQGQPILSTADIQWVLHHAGPTGAVPAVVRRGGRSVSLNLTLEPGWRTRDDLSWRATSWDLRRQLLGGMFVEEVPDGERTALGLGPGAMALRVKHVGQYSPHDRAKQAGVRQGDLVVGVDGSTERLSESLLFARLINRPKGETVTFTIRRGSETFPARIQLN